MYKHVMPFLAALSFGCSAADDWSEPAPSDSDLSGNESPDAPSSVSANGSISMQDNEGGPSALGQTAQAIIDVNPQTGCFAAVPPFIFPQDFFVLELGLTLGQTFQPRTFCGGSGEVAYLFAIQNYVRALGRPFAQPVNFNTRDCADLEVVYAVARDVGTGVPKQIVFQGTDRGEVRLDPAGQPFCEIGASLVASANIMPDGEDYFFAVQVVRDGSDGNTEPVSIRE